MPSASSCEADHLGRPSTEEPAAVVSKPADCAEALSQISIGYALCTGGDLTAAESHFLRVVEPGPNFLWGTL